jgi:hypothetical protein
MCTSHATATITTTHAFSHATIATITTTHAFSHATATATITTPSPQHIAYHLQYNINYSEITPPLPFKPLH